MSYVLSVIAFIVIFSVLVLVHEFGHFFMAKKAGIKVEEFGFGLPPRLWGKKKGETIYSINWIPFGGFVRMYGEDESDVKTLKSKRSFAAQSMLARVLVIIAGVVMNFLLAWFLLFIGFTVGMQPIIGDSEGYLNAIKSGQIVLEQGVKIKTVEEGTIAAQAGFKEGDVIYAIDGVGVDGDNLAEMAKNPAGAYGVVRGDEFLNIKVGGNDGVKSGLVFNDFGDFPRVRIFDLKAGTSAYNAGLRANDIILSVNGEQVLETTQYEALIEGATKVEYSVYRDGQVKQVTQSMPSMLEGSSMRRVIIEDVMSGSPAEQAGIKDEDIVVAIDGKMIGKPEEVGKYITGHQGGNLVFTIERSGQQIFYELRPVDGRAGILLAELISNAGGQGISIYNTNQLSSVSEIKNVQYPFYVAIYKSLEKSWEMSVTTAKMFTDFVGGLVRTWTIPDNVSGPIGIAQMTHGLVKEGLMPLLGFVVMLSLSLAVINILPFPALDGGRLLFIIIELIIGRRVNPKWENWIHVLGYFLIMLLILAVTYTDIVRLLN